MTSRTVLAAVVLVASAFVANLRAQVGPLTDPIPRPIPPSAIQVGVKPLAVGLVSPVYLTVVAGERGIDRKFIVDQTGLILIVKGGVLQPIPFLDVTSVVAQLSPAFGKGSKGLNPAYDERGLLGLAFHPGFARKNSPGYLTFYTLHTFPVFRPADFPQPPFPPGAMPNCQEVIAEWKASSLNPDRVDPNSYREVIRYDKPDFNHNGGTVAFGPDGQLYAALGDGGTANDAGVGHVPGVGNAQNLSTILGKVIRINPLSPRLTTRQDGMVSANGQYRIPRDNPFVNRPGVLGEIYAFGLRNPYRFSFDAANGRLVLGDVGQNNIEEVDIIRRGGNYGWHLKEGSFLFDPTSGNVFAGRSPVRNLIDPVAEYDHFEAAANKNTRVAIVGGFVYRGSNVPMLRGKYVCADLNGFVFDVDLATGKVEQLLDTGIFIKGFGQDSENEIYLLGSAKVGPSGTNGVVVQIVSGR
jgi:Glucose / Sorbosone dehydrogenase